MANPKDELIEYTYSKTVCQQRPECCKPREIDMVMFDADDTMWQIKPYGIASNITGRLVKVDEDTIEVEEEYTPKKHAYPTVKPLRRPPPLRQKRWWKQHPPQRVFEEWMETESEGYLSKEEELREIEAELHRSIEKAAPKKEEAVLLDTIRGWAPHQKSQVDHLMRLYGTGVCKITDVRDSGTIEIDCHGDKWLLTKDGQLMGEKKAATPSPAITTPAPEPTTIKHTITLLPTFRETMKELKDRGIRTAVISLNTPGTVKRIIDAFGMQGDFLEVQDTWQNKGKVFEEISKRQHVCPCNTMFVDNTASHVEDVAKKCGLALQIGKGKDIETPIEIMRFIK